MPTVCALAWLKQAAEQQYPGWYCQTISDYRLFKGIVFDGSEPANCTIELTLSEQSDRYIDLDARIASSSAQGKPVFHYAAQLRLNRDPLLAPRFKGELSNGQGTSATGLYRDGTLFHGESLQGIKALVHCDEQRLQLRCQLNEKATEKSGEFCLSQSNIFANDLVYQAMLVWVRKQHDMGSLPSATGQWLMYREVENTEPFDLLLKVNSFSRNQLLADIQLIDQNGVLIAEVKDAAVTGSDNLKQLFKPRK